MSKRIYKVKDKALNIVKLVRAGTPAQALGHVTKDRFEVKVASQDEIVDALNDDVTVETAGEQSAPPTDEQQGDPPAAGTPSSDELASQSGVAAAA